jgi:uncharacterized protein YPO0396
VNCRCTHECSSSLVEITKALELNASQKAGVAQRIEELAGDLATSARASEQAKRAKQRDDDLVSAQKDDDLEVLRASYAALRQRLAGAKPTRAEECAPAESALSDELSKRIEHLGRELGGYGQSLVQYMNEVLRRWPELRADMDATVESRADVVSLTALV